MKVGYFEAQHDFYAILGVPPAAPEHMIRTAYRRLVWELHPDRPGSRARAGRPIELVNLAATVLLNPAARARYDELWLAAKSGRLASPFTAAAPPRDAPGSRSARPARRVASTARSATPSYDAGAVLSDDFFRRLVIASLIATLLIVCISELTRPRHHGARAERAAFEIVYAPDYPPYPVRYAAADERRAKP